MKGKIKVDRLFIILMVLTLSVDFNNAEPHMKQGLKSKANIDIRVRAFLESHRYRWRDMNVPESDGRVLFDLIVKNNYKRALEIGTSTGHSAIWIAWALSKTGGKLITLEIDELRYKKALMNFRKSGLSNYIDARLGDAHEIVPKLKGPFDFVFVDADKDWYIRYLKLLLPKIKTDGCFAAHNVLNSYMDGIEEFLSYIRSLKNMETKIIKSSYSGISVSYKRSRN